MHRDFVTDEVTLLQLPGQPVTRWLTTLPQRHPNENKYDDRTETSTTKLGRSISGNQSPEQIIHMLFAVNTKKSYQTKPSNAS
jgi:hypothetical protein